MLVLDAADYGHAQRRQRLIVVATRDGIELDLTPPAIAAGPGRGDPRPAPGQAVTRRLYVPTRSTPSPTTACPHLVTYRRHASARRADRHPLATVTAGGNHHAVAHRARRRGASPDADQPRVRPRAGLRRHLRSSTARADVKRQIGNAVPVGIARWIGERAAAALGATTSAVAA